jgi:hypothetical protein
MGVGGWGKSVASPEKRQKKKNCNGKSGRPKGTVKSRMAKNGKAIKKKKKTNVINELVKFCSLPHVNYSLYKKMV